MIILDITINSHHKDNNNIIIIVDNNVGGGAKARGRAALGLLVTIIKNLLCYIIIPF